VNFEKTSTFSERYALVLNFNASETHLNTIKICLRAT